MKLWKLSVVLAAVAMISVPVSAQDDCASAVPAPATVDPCTDSTPTGPLGSCTSGGGVNDVWVSFVATAATARVRTDLGSVGTDSDYVIYDACGGNEVGCSEDNVGYLGDIEIGGLNIGQTYYIQVGGWSDSCGPYDVLVQDVVGGVCGDGIRSAISGETCDGNDAALCQGLCQPDCTCPDPVCGNNVLEAGEQCDEGAANGAVGCILPDCTCTGDCKVATDIVPAVSEWGLVVMVLIGLAAGTVMFGRKRAIA